MKPQLACIVTAVSFFATAPLVQAADAPHYVKSVQKGERERVVGSSGIPPDKGYEQLSADEKKLVRASFAGLSDDDEPPYPVHGIQAMIRAAHREAASNAEESVLHLVAKVSATGAVESVDIRSAPDATMGHRVAELLRKSDFKPARCKGAPCAMDFPLVLRIVP